MVISKALPKCKIENTKTNEKIYLHKIILYCYTDKSEDVGDVINSLLSLWHM